MTAIGNGRLPDAPAQDRLPARPAWFSPQAARGFLARFLAAPVQVDARERVRAFLGAGLGILFTAWVSRWLAEPSTSVVWLIAPMGASAVLVFAVPASPLAQPWSVLGGNTVSALVGITCANLIGEPAWAASVGVAVAIGLMLALRCLHPPGGATALLAVLVHATSYRYALFPVMLNSLLLVVFGVFYNSLTGRPYPHVQRTDSKSAASSSRFSSADLDNALAHYNQVLDVSRDDLEKLLHHAELAAYQRNLGNLLCVDIMTREPLAVQYGTALHDAWLLMRKHQIKALPVTDRVRRIVGIVTVADFLRHADLDQPEGLGDRLRAFVRRSGTTHSSRPEVVGQIMTRTVRVASAHRHVIELVPLFSEGGHHHVPIIDEANRLVGMITQSDLVRTLYRAVRTEH